MATRNLLLEWVPHVFARLVLLRQSRYASGFVMPPQAFSEEDADGSKGGKQAIKLWDNHVKSVYQAVKKAQGDLVKETNRINNQKAKDAQKELKAKAAKEKAATKAIAAPEDSGEQQVGVEAWPIYMSMSEVGMDNERAWRHHALSGDSPDWEPDVRAPSLINLSGEDVEGALLDGPAGTAERDDMLEWYEYFPSAQAQLEKATA